MATYLNFLRLTELATGEGSGTWGTTTNQSLELIGEALGYATQQVFGSDADATTTIADGASDPARAMYFKITSAGNLTATRTCTIAPNTVSRVMFIENATSGSQSIAISQGSGANVTIATGKTAVVYLDGAGAGAAVVDAMAGVDPGVTDTLAEVLTAGNTTTTDQKIQFRDSAIYINSSVDGQLDIVADTEIQIAATTIDVNGTLAFDSLKGTGATTVTNILDEDNMASDSATAIATQQSIKAYVDSQVGSFDTLAEVLAQGNTTGGTDLAVSSGDDITFADSSKAIFGADSDFKVYHSGTTGLIENYTGSLFITNSSDDFDVVIQSDNGAGSLTDYFRADGSAGSALLYHYGSQKLATTTSGIDVTGDIVLGDNNPTITMNDSSVVNLQHLITSSSDNLIIAADNNDVDAGTEIQFYVDGAERMSVTATGIDVTGTATMDGLTVSSDSGGPVYLQDSNATATYNISELSNNAGNFNVQTRDSSGVFVNTDYQIVKNASGADYHRWFTQGTERLRLDASGRLGIGTTSPRSLINALSATGAILTLESSDTTLGENDVVGQIDFYANDASTNSTGNKAFIKAYSETAGGNKVGLDFATSSSTSATGVVAMTINSDGDVGIGTSSPNALLEVEESGTGSGLGGVIASTITAGGNAGYRFVTGGVDRFSLSTIGSAGSESLRFYDSNSSAERMRITSAGTLQIAGNGTDNDSYPITFTNGAAAIARDDNDLKLHGYSNIIFGVSNTSYPASTERMRIDVSGNVGIGESNPSGLLHLTGDTNSNGAELFLQVNNNNTTDNLGAIHFGNNVDETLNRILGGTSGANNSSYLTFSTSNAGTLSEAARIDAAGNAVFGKSVANNTVVGTTIYNDNGISVVRDSNVTAIFNRLTDDGDVITLRKDGTTVGSIGTTGSDLYIGTGDTQLRFNDSGDEIRPAGTDGSGRDGLLSLGSSTKRFKDLYLSGGVYLGGTGAANLLDDYEEGTWIPLLTAVSGTKTWTYSAQRGTYTKVGNLVTVFFNIQLTSNGSGTDGNARLTGLPFASATDTSLVAYYAFFWKQLINTTDVSLMGQLPVGGDYINFLDGSSSYPDISYLNTSLFVNDRRVRGSIQYRV